MSRTSLQPFDEGLRGRSARGKVGQSHVAVVQARDRDPWPRVEAGKWGDPTDCETSLGQKKQNSLMNRLWEVKAVVNLRMAPTLGS